MVYVGVSATLGGIRQFHEYKAEQEAKRWLDLAQRDAMPTWTEDDAVAWLRQQDFEAIGTGKGVSSSVGRPDEHFFSVMGYRQFEKGGVIVKPSSVYVEFYFDMEHRFKQVKSDTWPFKPPGRK